MHELGVAEGGWIILLFFLLNLLEAKTEFKRVLGVLENVFPVQGEAP